MRWPYPIGTRTKTLLVLSAILLCGLLLASFSAVYVRLVVTPRDWSRRTQVVDVSTDTAYLATAIDPFDRIHVVFTDKRNGRETVFYVKLDATGKILVPLLQVSEGWGTSTSPYLSVDSAGNAHIVWVDNRDGNDEIYYSNIDSSGTKTKFDKRLTHDPRQSLAPAIAVDSKGNVHVVWQDLREEIKVFPVDFEVYYLKLNNDGNVLISEKRLTPADTKYSLGPSIAIDKDDHVHVFWIDNRETEPFPFHELYYKMLDQDGNALTQDRKILQISKRIVPPRAPRPLIDLQGRLILVFLDERPRLRYTVYLATLDSNGTSIGADQRITSSSRVLGGYADQPKATIAANREVYVVTSDLRPDWGIQKLRKNGFFQLLFGDWKFTPLYLEFRRQLYGVRLAAGQILGEDWITSAPEESTMPSICSDSHGTLHLVWLHTSQKLTSISYADNAKAIDLPIWSILAEYGERIAHDWEVAMIMFPLFAIQEVLWLALFLLSASLVVFFTRWAFRKSLTTTRLVIIQLLTLVFLRTLLLSLFPVSMTYPRGLAQIFTGILAALMTVCVALVGKAQMTTKGRQMSLALASELLNFFYALCFIAPIALDPVY